MKKLNLLVSAYACNPIATEESYPGEAILGWNLIKQLSRFHDVSVITRTYNRDAISEVKEEGSLSDINFHYLTLPRLIAPIKKNFLGFSFYYLLWQIKAYFLARKLHKRNEFDAFHHITFNNDWMPSFIGAYLQIPFIWGPMGGGQKVPPSFRKTIHWKNRINQSLRVVGQWFWRKTVFRKKCAQKALAILVCNKDTEKKIPNVENKIYPFPVNGISYKELTSAQPVHKNEGQIFRVVYAGRLDAIKGLNLGIRAFHLFVEKHPNSQFQIIGIGPEKKRLEDLVKNLNLQDKIIFTSWLSRNDLFAQIDESDVLLFPSFRDGGGQVIIEAMAQGKPVIGVNVGGPGFHIREEWGFRIEPKSPELTIQGMTDALERLSVDENLRKKMGSAGRQRAEEYYLWDKLGDRLQHIYENVLPTG